MTGAHATLGSATTDIPEALVGQTAERNCTLPLKGRRLDLGEPYVQCVKRQVYRENIRSICLGRMDGFFECSMLGRTAREAYIDLLTRPLSISCVGSGSFGTRASASTTSLPLYRQTSGASKELHSARRPHPTVCRARAAAITNIDRHVISKKKIGEHVTGENV